MGYYSDNLTQGKRDEDLVVRKLVEAGYKVTKPTEYQDRREDIDIILHFDDLQYNMSIKSQQAGLKYGQIYFELYQKVKPEFYDKFDCQHKTSWVESNHFTGKHDGYAIYQGSSIYLIHRTTVDQYVTDNGWVYVKPLSKYRREALARQVGYPFCDSKCGFLPNNVLSCFDILGV